MGNGIYLALSGAVAQGTALDVTSNNVANAGTAGYQAERMRFSAVMKGARDGAFVAAAGGGIDTRPGTVRATGNPLDLAMGPDQYLELETSRGARYTRATALRLDPSHRLVTAEGDAVKGDKGPLTVPPTAADVAIGEDGVLRADGAEIGRLSIRRFRPESLQREGATRYVATGAPEAGPPPEVQPGALEDANFNVVRGVVDLVRVSRSYEALTKMIESYRDIDDRAARSIAGRG